MKNTISFVFLLIVMPLVSCNRSQNLLIHNDFQVEFRYQASNETSLNLQNSTKINLMEKASVISGNGTPSDPFRCVLELKNNSGQIWSGTVLIELVGDYDDARFFLPGFLYGKNQGKTGYNPNLIKQFPRLRKGKVHFPYSPYWFARSDQLTHPVAMMFTNGMVAGISGSPYAINDNPVTFWSPSIENSTFHEYNGFMASMEKKVSVGYTAGYVDAPGIYTRPQEVHEFDGSGKGIIEVKPGETIMIPFSVYLFDADHESSVSEVIRNVYHEFHEVPSYLESAEATISEISRAISEDAYSAEHKTYGLISKPPAAGHIDLIDGGQVTYSTKPVDFDQYISNFEGLIAWTNGTVIAVPLLQASYYNGNQALRTQAIEVIDNIVHHSLNPATGIPFCTHINGNWTNKGWWTEWVKSEGKQAEHSSYIVGQALYYILKAYELEKSNTGTIHDEWLNFVTDILHRIKESQNKDGAFPRFWDETVGHGKEYDAFSGCWVAAAMAYHAKVTGETVFLQSSHEAEQHYYEHVKRMECIKTPLDVADAPDSEGVLAYIRLTKILFEITGKENYLKKLKAGLDYELTFKFCYNVPVTGEPLSNTDWNSSGGSITSVCNAVVHCMSNSILDELLFYYNHTGDEYYASRLKDTWLWGLQAYNREEREYFFGKKGWSTEYFCQANRYVLDIRLTDQSRSSIWFAYHPWATASILEGLTGKMLRNTEILTSSK